MTEGFSLTFCAKSFWASFKSKRAVEMAYEVHAVSKPTYKVPLRGLAFPTVGKTLAGGATSFSRSSFAIFWWSGPTNDVAESVLRLRKSNITTHLSGPYLNRQRFSCLWQPRRQSS